MREEKNSLVGVEAQIAPGGVITLPNQIISSDIYITRDSSPHLLFLC